jgi:hypothetical protein
MNFPFSFYFANALLIFLGGELFNKRKTSWAVPLGMVYLTIFAWYFSDILLYPEKYEDTSAKYISYSYWQVSLFLIILRLSIPYTVRWTIRPKSGLAIMHSQVRAESVFKLMIVLWAGLLIVAVSQLNWDFVGALFPLDSRAGALMWQRAAAAGAGPFGFLISTGGYLYMVTCSFFGILAVLQKRIGPKLAACCMILVSWPFYLLNGTRNSFLAVFMPWVFTYAFFGRQQKIIKISLLILSFVSLQVAFKVVVGQRGLGFRDFLSENKQEQKDVVKETKHEGLNMMEELCFINTYFQVDNATLGWGKNYLIQITSIVPRAIWANKPLQGIEYAKWRGFEDTSGQSDIGVVATVSTGIIGQGVLEFGLIAGPIAPAILMALWCGLLSRWWVQRASILRLSLFMLGVGITFNLGRNITMIILWPIAFAYVLVRIIENVSSRRKFVPLPVSRSVTLPTKRWKSAP